MNAIRCAVRSGISWGFGSIAVSIQLLCLGFFFSGLQVRGEVVVQIGQNFRGSTYSVNTPYLPADSNGDVGPRHYMEFINGTVAVYNKTNGVSVQRKSNAKFWSDAGLIISPDSGLSDPRVIYDPTVQRWFALQIDLDANAQDPTLEANDFLLAVSATSDPTGQWRGVSFQADPDFGQFADFPTIGLDANAVYISGDFFHGEQFAIGPGLVSIPKADLLGIPPNISNRTWFGVMDYNDRGDILQPAICFDGSATGNILAMGDIGSDSDPHSNVVTYAVLNGATATATLTAPTSLLVPPYVVPMNDALGVPTFTPTQPDNTSTISANEGRISSHVFAVKGVLYAVHSTEVNGRIAIRWYRINAATDTLLESGTIADSNLDLFYPAIAANTNGTVVIACNGCSINTYVSSFAFVGQVVNGVTSFGPATLLQSGTGLYHGDDEFIAELLEEPAISRWGDYSAISVDPIDSTHFWTIQMIPSEPSDPEVPDAWSTQITEIIAVSPTLSLSVSNNNSVVSWPSGLAGYNLETSTNLALNAWSTVSGALSTNSGRISFQSSLTNRAAFYRLHKP